MKNKGRRIAFLTYYLMIAGLVGLLVSFLRLRVPGAGFWFWFTLGLQTLLYMACFYSGYLFLNKDNKRAAEWGIFVHILQLFSFTAWGWSYYFVAGFGATISYVFADTDARFAINAGISEFEWSLVSERLPVEFGVNVIAVLILIILLGVRRKHLHQNVILG